MGIHIVKLRKRRLQEVRAYGHSFCRYLFRGGAVFARTPELHIGVCIDVVLHVALLSSQTEFLLPAMMYHYLNRSPTLIAYPVGLVRIRELVRQ
jgi:hypothetical protein